MAILNSDGSASDTQTQITAAANEDTVRLPSVGSFTWSSNVTIPNTKNITVDLNGSTVTISGAAIEFTVRSSPAGSTTANRVTNGNIVRGTGHDAFSGTFVIDPSATGVGVRADHLTFTGSDVLVDIEDNGPGVMDHCSFPDLEGAQEFIHCLGLGPSDKAGWTTYTGDELQGSNLLFYFEDCTFTTNTAEANVAWIQGYYGCYIAIRYCTFNYTSVDMHGTAGNIGARWWECYSNTFDNDTGDNQTWAFSFRAGSGVIYNNSFIGVVSADIGLCEEDTGYPALWQIGRGKSTVGANPTTGSELALDPAYVWNNTGMTLSLNSCDAPEQPNMVQLNRDVYASTKSGYSPYTYPHPLTGVTNNITYSGTGTFTTVTIG